jgi:predicted RNA-binding protein with PIN domain
MDVKLNDIGEFKWQKKCSAIAKQGALRLEGIDNKQGVQDVMEDVRKRQERMKKKKPDYRYEHYNLKPI